MGAAAPAHALPEADERIDQDGRAGQRHERQAGVVVEEQADVADEREAFPDEVADGLRHHLLHLVDVVVDPRELIIQRVDGARGGRSDRCSSAR